MGRRVGLSERALAQAQGLHMLELAQERAQRRLAMPERLDRCVQIRTYIPTDVRIEELFKL